MGTFKGEAAGQPEDLDVLVHRAKNGTGHWSLPGEIPKSPVSGAKHRKYTRMIGKILVMLNLRGI
jgi:hypothetical protein